MQQITQSQRESFSGNQPLSFAQQRFWFLDQLVPDQELYILSCSLSLIGLLDTIALEKSLNEIIRRHEIMRATVASLDGYPTVAIVAALTISLPVESLEVLSDEAQEARLQEITQTRRSFDVEQGPLFHIDLVRLGQNRHVLLVNIHQIIADVCSIHILLRELEALYAAFVGGKPSPLTKLPYQYSDYVHWQQESLQGKVRDELIAYWQSYLAGAPQFLDLPTDHAHPATQNYRREIQTFQIDHNLYAALQQFSQQEKEKVATILLAAFQILLARYSGRDDFLIGMSMSNRMRAEDATLIGRYANTAVLRYNLADNLSFRQFLGRVGEALHICAIQHEIPFELLIEALQSERNVSYHPLIQVSLTVQDSSIRALELPFLSTELSEMHEVLPGLDLALSVRESSDGLQCVFAYDGGLFEQATIERLQGYFLTLLQSIIETPKQCVFDLQILTPQEKYYLLHELNPSSLLEEGSNPSTLCLHQFFEAQAQRTPEAVALYDGEETLSYRELNRQAQVLSFQLRELGVGPEMLVGLCMRRSTQLVVGLLAILKAGGAYVPLDPTYPEERLAFILNDTQASILLTQSSLRERLPDYQGTVILLDSALLDDDGEASEFLERATTGNLAYVIYTSGSTGRPKGVAITHGSAAQLVAWAQKVYAREELSGVLASTSICFDLSIFEIFVPLSVGGSCILVENALQLSSQTAMNTITLVNTVPSVAREVLRTGGFPSSVQTINLAGEALSLKLVQDLYAHTQVRRIFNLYGPSEDTTYSTSTLLASTTSDVPSIGRPLESTRVYLLDERLCLVPPGMPGEIYIGGAGLARGYLNRPDLSAERFIPDTFSGEPGARLYKTGDLARYLVDGRLDFLGRIDHQIKLRGFRIELGEIETILDRHSAVEQAIVVVRNDDTGSQSLIAYVLPQMESSIDVAQLRQVLRDALPAYMVPSDFVVLKALPLTPSGKVDRRALTELVVAPVLTREEVRPRTPVEEILLQIWIQVLKRSRISIYDDFFDLGGHSLLVTQVMVRLRRTFRMHVDLQEVFSARTIAQIADMLVRYEPKPGHVATIARIHQQVSRLSTEEIHSRLAVNAHVSHSDRK